MALASPGRMRWPCVLLLASALAGASHAHAAVPKAARAPRRPRPVASIENWQPRKTTWPMWAAAGAQTVATAWTAGQAVAGAQGHGGKLALAVASGWVLADFISGRVHKWIDAYGDEHTPLFGGMIQQFNHHHRRPFDATRMKLLPALWGATKFTAPLALALPFFDGIDPVTKAFAISTLAGLAFSQHSHNLSHIPPSRRGPLLKLAQATGVFLRPSHVRKHHPSPQSSHFEPLNGSVTPIIEATGWNRHEERLLWYVLRAVPRPWNDRALAPPSYLDDEMHDRSAWARLRLDLSTWWKKTR